MTKEPGATSTEPMEHDMPSVGELYTSAGRAVARRWYLVPVMMAFLYYFPTVEYLGEEVFTGDAFSSATGVGSLVSFLLWLLMFFAVRYIASVSTVREASIGEGVGWTRRRGVGRIALGIVTWAGTLIGLALLVVPGLAMYVITHSARFAYVHEGAGFVTALRRSWSLIAPRFGAVAIRVLPLVPLTIAFIVLPTLVSASVFGGYEGAGAFENALVEWVTELVTMTMFGLWALMGQQVGLRVYQHLSGKGTSHSTSVA
ncbi:MAG: hypothetical protein AAF467_03350 [Actinomycetota bacterium]